MQLLLQGEPQTPKKSFITPAAITDVPTYVFAKLSFGVRKVEYYIWLSHELLLICLNAFVKK